MSEDGLDCSNALILTEGVQCFSHTHTHRHTHTHTHTHIYTHTHTHTLKKVNLAPPERKRGIAERYYTKYLTL